jgi:hypothetical protein
MSGRKSLKVGRFTGSDRFRRGQNQSLNQAEPSAKSNSQNPSPLARMARSPGGGDLWLEGRESHIPRYRSVMLLSEGGEAPQMPELGTNSGILLAPVSASAENYNRVLTHDQVAENYADISIHEKLRHAGLIKCLRRNL